MFEQKYLEDPFLFRAGEYEGDDDTVFVNERGRPVSVWSAIQLLREEDPEEFRQMAREVWELEDPDLLLSEAVMLKVIETAHVKPPSWLLEKLRQPDYFVEVGRKGFYLSVEPLEPGDFKDSQFLAASSL